MIISASYRTDIPAFYGKWFLNRLRVGYCKRVNPYNRRVSLINLSKEVVEGIVFWTRNPLSFLEGFDSVRNMGYPFYLQFTITGYPEILDKHVPRWEDSVVVFEKISRKYGPHSVVWRYDPILFSSLSDEDFHIRNFSRISRSLEGLTSEVIVSFTSFYRKTIEKMNRLSGEEGIRFYDPPDAMKISFASRLADIARSCGMSLSLCGQRDLLSEGVADACCIDPFRLSDVAGKILPLPPERSHRPGSSCGCYAARDVGEYETCIHGCLYCYAVKSGVTALKNFRSHDPDGEFLLPPPGSQRLEGRHYIGTQGFLF